PVLTQQAPAQQEAPQQGAPQPAPAPQEAPPQAPARQAPAPQAAPQQAPAKPQQAPVWTSAPRAARPAAPASTRAPAPQAKKREAPARPDGASEGLEDTLVRSVLRDELELKIASRVFDQTFRSADLQAELPYAPEMSGWLGERLKNLAEQRNARLS